MAVSTKAFTLTTGAYQDISEGNEIISFLIKNPRDSAVRIHLGTSLPAAETANYETFLPPPDIAQSRNVDPTTVAFSELSVTDLCYARADSANITIAVFRK